jgi:hypothetical protein
LDKEESKRFNDEYDVWIGELVNGNNNPEIKKKLKNYIFYFENK